VAFNMTLPLDQCMRRLFKVAAHLSIAGDVAGWRTATKRSAEMKRLQSDGPPPRDEQAPAPA
jgi:hypothetical protein